MNDDKDKFGISSPADVGVGFFKVFARIWVLGAIVSLIGTGVIVYVVFHFLAKFW